MGYSTDALVWVSFNRQTFDTKSSLQQYIDDLKERIKDCEDGLRELVMMTEPNKFCPQGSNVAGWLHDQFDEYMEELEYAYFHLPLAESLLRDWDRMHHPNGCAYAGVPGRSMEEEQRMDGDYIPTCNRDGSCANPEDEYSVRLYDNMVGNKKDG